MFWYEVWLLTVRELDSTGSIQMLSVTSNFTLLPVPEKKVLTKAESGSYLGPHDNS